ncbi:hypothetical protein T03_801 [Trichinella britovi]|uniref:Uncharacterized protein n=1 Tax=Trichinella britovi TaxID=45882 RepID=A0A0V1CZY7_TRIBR|nr:hypothetical protein T03_801 [Trichinella britovi]
MQVLTVGRKSVRSFIGKVNAITNHKMQKCTVIYFGFCFWMDSKDADYDEELLNFVLFATLRHSRRAKDALILEAKRAKERSKTMENFESLFGLKFSGSCHRSGLVKEVVGCWDLLCVVVSEIANVPVRGTDAEPHPLVV